jgi:hypothetical protein
MAKKFLSAIRLLNLSTDPVSASAGEIYYNSTNNAVKFYNGSSWQALASGESLVDSGPSYPITSLSNGQLFYNTTNGRTAIFFDSTWKEFAYLADSISTNGGAASTTIFDNNIDGGIPSTTVFINNYDGGTE